MNSMARRAGIALLLLSVSLTTLQPELALGQTGEGARGAATVATAEQAAESERKREERREFQSQELMLAKSGTWIFKPGETPRILWWELWGLAIHSPGDL